MLHGLQPSEYDTLIAMFVKWSQDTRTLTKDEQAELQQHSHLSNNWLQRCKLALWLGRHVGCDIGDCTYCIFCTARQAITKKSHMMSNDCHGIRYISQHGALPADVPTVPLVGSRAKCARSTARFVLWNGGITADLEDVTLMTSAANTATPA